MDWPFDPAQLAQVYCVRSAALSLGDKMLQRNFTELFESLRGFSQAMVYVNNKNKPSLFETKLVHNKLPGRLYVIYISLLNHALQTQQMMLHKRHRHFPSVFARLMHDAPRRLMKGGGFILLSIIWESAIWMPRIHNFIEAAQTQEKRWTENLLAFYCLNPNTDPAIRERLLALAHDCYFVARLDGNGQLCAAEKGHCQVNGKSGPPRQVYTDIFQPPLEWTMSTTGLCYQAPPGSWVIVGESGLLPMDLSAISFQLHFILRAVD